MLFIVSTSNIGKFIQFLSHILANVNIGLISTVLQEEMLLVTKKTEVSLKKNKLVSNPVIYKSKLKPSVKGSL